MRKAHPDLGARGDAHLGLGAFALFAAVVACYFNSFGGAFQFDDYKVIVDNPSVHSLSAWAAQGFTGIRPLLKLSYALNWTSGLGLPGYHAFNLALHLGNTFLVFRLTEALLDATGWAADKRQLSLATALLFAVHPMHTEAITYICGRSVSFMAFFYLAGLLAFAQTNRGDHRLRGQFLTIAFFGAALLVKETAITFPLALLTWTCACGTPWRIALRTQWPSWVLAGLAGSLFLLNEKYLAHLEGSAGLNSLSGNIVTQLGGFAYLMRQWGLPLWPNIDPDLPLHRDVSGLLLSLVVALALGLVWALWRLRGRPWLAFAMMWSVVHLLLIYMVFPRLDVANDRQLYLADWPLFLALSIEASQVFRSGQWPRYLPMLLLALVLSCLAIARNKAYRSEIALWQDTVEKSPGKARAHNNLGYAYMLGLQSEQARREFLLALQCDPNFIKAQHNLWRLESKSQ
jgi:hypothetical protein